MQLIHKKTLGLLIGAALLVPGVTVAANLTPDQVTAITSLLQSFNVQQNVISNVQLVLTNQGSHQWTNASSSMMGSTTPWMPPGQAGKMACIALTRNLGPGSRGDDVMSLQQLLAQDPTSGFTASSTGFFGPMTARAVARWQEHNGIASSTSGFVGPMTRGFLNRHCGKGLDMMMGHPGPGPGGEHASSTATTTEDSNHWQASSTEMHGGGY